MITNLICFAVNLFRNFQFETSSLIIFLSKSSAFLRGDKDSTFENPSTIALTVLRYDYDQKIDDANQNYYTNRIKPYVWHL